MDNLLVLYDGWSLVHAPLSPQAIHLQAVLAYIPSEVSAVVALPQEPPVWLGNIEKYVHVTSNSLSGRLRWEQLTLPRLAHKLGARVLHLTTPTAPLLSDLVTLVSPCDYNDRFTLGKNLEDCRGFAGRLRCSFARGGMSRVKGFLWPDDLPGTSQSIPLIELPPIVPPDFKPEAELDSPKGSPEARSLSAQLQEFDLPESYILYHGPGGQGHLKQLIEAWKWAAPAIGDYYPLLVAGLNSASQQILNRLAESQDLRDNLRVLSGITPKLLPDLYRKSHAVFHPAPASPWGGAVRLALATGKPLVAAERSLTDAIVGPAAYLAAEGDERALGAALVTIVVEEPIAEKLSKSSLQRSINWRDVDYAEHLLAAYSNMI